MARVAVTGAFSYSGRYLAKRLLEQGHTVVNLSSRPQQLSSSVAFSDAELRRVEQRPLSFREEEVTDALKGCSVLWCTYWIRFEKDGDTFDRAAARCASLRPAPFFGGGDRYVGGDVPPLKLAPKTGFPRCLLWWF
ncbi:unnamed protein product [Effrenium voratum]|nr:unnamed protein product [Effrenium voratum]